MLYQPMGTTCSLGCPRGTGVHTQATDDHVGMSPRASQGIRMIPEHGRFTGWISEGEKHEYQARLRAPGRDGSAALAGLGHQQGLRKSQGSYYHVKGAQPGQVWTALAAVFLKAHKHRSQNKNNNQTRSLHDYVGANQQHGHSWHKTEIRALCRRKQN